MAHEEIDLKNPQVQPRQRRLFGRGARQVYRAAQRRLYRYLARGKPDVEGVYSWWSYRFNARKNNAGWRIDYFLVSDSIAANVRDTGIRGDIFGSDHCPVTLTLEL